MMVLECIYIRKALERIDARNAIEEEGEIPAIQPLLRKIRREDKRRLRSKEYKRATCHNVEIGPVQTCPMSARFSQHSHPGGRQQCPSTYTMTASPFSGGPVPAT